MNVLSRLHGYLRPNFHPGTDFKILTRGFKTVADKQKIELKPKSKLDMPKDIIDVRRNLFKCTLFTVGFSGAVFVGTSIWQYENIRKLKEFRFFDPDFFLSYEEKLAKQPNFREELNKVWNSLRDGTKTFLPICFLNIVVFLGWKIPVLRSTMYRYFTFSPHSRIVCLPMVLSTFSHFSIFHLGINMFVLKTFTLPMCEKLDRQQFVALYLCSGVFSSLTGAFYKVLIGSINPSIGASGAIMGIFGYFCSKNPDLKVAVVFLEQFPFSAARGLMSLMIFDTVGVLMRWKIFDHAAHLGGAIFGLFYCKYGDRIWDMRKPIIEQWHKMREAADKK